MRKPILRWPGGKTRALKHILPRLRPHTTYVEGFAGGLAVLLAKEPSKAEIVNDLNGELVNLYRYAQFHLDALVAEVEWTLNSRSTLADLVKQPGLTGLQHAARYLLRNRMSFGGGGQNFAVTKQAQPSRANVLAALRDFSSRLDKVAVENLPYERLCALYDSPQTCWFLDPPYSTGKVDAYDLWTQDQMTRFAGVVQELAGGWVVTINDCLHNRQLFSRHDITPIVTSSQAVNRRLKPEATFGELVICKRLKPAAARTLKNPLKGVQSSRLALAA